MERLTVNILPGSRVMWRPVPARKTLDIPAALHKKEAVYRLLATPPLHLEVLITPERLVLILFDLKPVFLVFCRAKLETQGCCLVVRGPLEPDKS